MPRAKLNKLYRTFVKGLITEASPLTYPENASTSELNTIVSRKGNRTRRQGIRYEESFVMNNIPDVGDNFAINEYVWHSVAKIQGKAVTVIQIGDIVHFWEMDTLPLSDNKLSYTVDLKNFKSPTANVLDIKLQAATFSSGAGFLFIAHPMCDPVVVEYLQSTNTYEAIRVFIQIRDFAGVYDGLANDEEPYYLSKEHNYNLLNQGWMYPGDTIIPAVADGEITTPPAPPPSTAPSAGGDGSGSGTGGGASGGSGEYYDPYTGYVRKTDRIGGGAEFV